MGIALGIDFSWIFVDFRRQVGAKLAPKIDRKSMQKNIQKMKANKRHLGGVLKASWKSRRCPEAGRPPMRLRPGDGGATARREVRVTNYRRTTGPKVDPSI